jgi:hypothetical protein
MLSNEEIQEIILQETLTLLPRKDLKLSTSIDKIDLYTSEKLKEKFKQLISNQKILQPGIDDINKLIDKDLIVPVLASKSILQILAKKIFTPKSKLDTMSSERTIGFYSAMEKKIFMLLDNNTSYIFFTQDDQIASTLLHELQHFSSDILPKEFLSTHKESLQLYFQELIRLVFNVKITKQDSFSLVSWIYYNVERTKAYGTGILIKYATYLEKLLLKYLKPNDPNLERISSFLSSLHLYLSSFTSFVMALKSGNRNVISTVVSLQNSYKKLGINTPESLCIQELWAPSEIICVESQQNTSSKHFKLLPKLTRLAK